VLGYITLKVIQSGLKYMTARPIHIIGHFRDESFQCTGTDNQKQSKIPCSR